MSARLSENNTRLSDKLVTCIRVDDCSRHASISAARCHFVSVCLGETPLLAFLRETVAADKAYGIAWGAWAACNLTRRGSLARW